MNSMVDDYAGLDEVLQQQSGIVNELIELGLAETEAFKIDDVAGIRSTVERQKEAIDRMMALERRKAAIVGGDTVSRVRAYIPSGNVSAGMHTADGADKLDVVGEADAGRWEIEAAAAQLVKMSRRLQQINETNRLLARMSLSYTRMMQKALGVAPNGSYDRKGMPSAGPGYLGRLDASA